MRATTRTASTMFRAMSLAGGVAVIAGTAITGTALVGASPVQAATQKIAPIPAADCTKLKDDLQKIIGLPLTTSTAAPDAETFLVKTQGNACVISGKGDGASADFGDASEAISKHFKDWKPNWDMNASGPYSEMMAFSKGNRMVIYTISADPPVGKCEPDPNSEELAECDLPAGEWVWLVETIAYDKVK